ncbi:hypothetical protein [Sphingobacterium chungjuense]|uniref:hypothetical protein n=1 Tax=Sphingobacterium chungjuense TaxID=2675553 RepID=UPI00140B4FB9|nr:hypothetical protein [Sphingobacterium chungjuense]
MKTEEQGCKQQDQGKQKPSFMQIVNHPVTYAMIVIVTVFNLVFYYIIDLNKDSREAERKLNEKMLEMQGGLYQQMIDEIRPAVNKVTEAAIKVDSAAVKVDSVAQQQKGKRK